MQIIAHRGYAARYPELTEIAYRKALDVGVDGIECDVRLTADGHLVCMHDATVDRVSDGRGRVSTLRLAELRRLNVGTAGLPQRILTLAELLELWAPSGTDIYIETKHPTRFGPLLEDELARVLRARRLERDPRVHIISFSFASIERMARRTPCLDGTYLRRNVTGPLAIVDPVPAGATSLGLSVARARRQPGLVGSRGLPTYLFTADDPADMRWAQSHGIDRLATNECALAREVLGRGA